MTRAICQNTQAQLKSELILILKRIYPEVIIKENYIYAEGAIPIALIAHLDTVHRQLPYQIYHDKTENIMWSPQGLGADDRAGVVAILKLLDAGYRPHVIFTLNEETTANGALDLSKIKMPFSELQMMIELDRCGQQDSVFYSCNNLAFEEYINKYGFKTAEGTFSDIKLIAPKWGVAAVNLSVGYEHEHTLGETLSIDWLNATIIKVGNIFDDILVNNRHQIYKYIPKKSNIYCDFCGEALSEDEAINIKFSSENNNYFEYWLCEDCYDDIV